MNYWQISRRVDATAWSVLEQAMTDPEFASDSKSNAEVAEIAEKN